MSLSSLDSEVDYFINWSNLPELVIIKIFEKLSLEDRIKASVVCQSWSRGFDSPTLWRYASFVFHTTTSFYAFLQTKVYPNSFSNEKALDIAGRYGRYIKFLQLICEPLTIPDESQNRMGICLERLAKEGCILKKLSVFIFHCFMEWDHKSRQALFDNLVDFVKTQSQLKCLQFDTGLFDDEVRLLKAVVDSSGKSLESLYFIITSTNVVTWPNIIQDTYYLTLGRLPNLKHLFLCLEFLDTTLLSTLAENCKNLKILYLRCLEVIVPPKRITSKDWIYACKLQPALRVIFEAGLLRYSDLHVLMVPLAPLVSIDTSFERDPDSEITWNFNRLLNYITSSFCQTLVNLYLQNYNDSENVDESLSRLLRNCPRLRRLQVSANLSITVIEDICKLQIDGKIDLRKFWLYVKDVSQEDKLKLNEISSKYKPMMEFRNWKLEC